jgi:hypothetical protein
MAKNPQMVAEKWARNLGGATESIKAGIASVTVSPTEKAANRADAYASGVQQAVSTGRFQRGLRRVSLTDWQRAITNKGIPRIAAGAAEAKPKMAQFLADFLPHVEAGVASLPARGDTETNINRAVAMMRHNAGFARRS